MRSRVVLASLLAASFALAACGWLLPDGVLETTAGDAAAEDSGTASDAASKDSGSIADAGADSGVIVDAGDPTWGTPVFLRGSPPDAGTIVLRQRDAGDVFYSLVRGYYDEGSLFYAPAVDAASILITYDGGALLGNAPAPFAYLGFEGIFFVGGGWIHSRVLRLDGGVALDPDTTHFDGGAPSDPYVTTLGGCFFATATGLFRGDSALNRVDPITIKTRDTGAPPKPFRTPVPTARETTLYYGYGNASGIGIWVATRTGDSEVTFIDAHPLFPNSTEHEFPTAVSDDGTQLIFTRISEGGSAAYLVKQL